ncbi:60S ribosomal protein L35 [Galendromus occidentalis]|uniref:Large ribosomal subunit protein uL29 n=1 Tax=Galendromus occidentalis TaxID=34638 RepID=A0AAJ6QQB4_9ACAR|nr:60S ribosomal protein L35 [Galendromus occidentalis]
MTKLRAAELRGMKKEDLEKKLDELKSELSNLRNAKVTGANASKVAKIRMTRKNISRLLTIMTEVQRENLVKFYRNKKRVPLDLRLKRTRAQRRALTPYEQSIKSRKQRRREATYPRRKYAVKA